MDNRVKALRDDLEARIAKLQAEQEQEIADLYSGELDLVKDDLMKALEGFTWELDTEIRIYPSITKTEGQPDAISLNFSYGEIKKITPKVGKVGKAGEAGKAGNGVKLLIPKDVQEAWGTEAEYPSKQAFYKVIAPGVEIGTKADIQHAERDAFNRMKADGATEGGMTLTKAWGKILAHN